MLLSRSSRATYNFPAEFFRPDGRVTFADYSTARAFAAQMSAKRALSGDDGVPVPASDIYALYLLDEALRTLMQHYFAQNHGVMTGAALHLLSTLGKDFDLAFASFVDEFPPMAVYRREKEEFERLTGGKVFEGYGLSEAPTATHCNPLLGVNKTGSIGMPLPDVDVKIISLDDGETEMAQGEIGEVAVKGPQVMKGYHNMPTETANTLRQLKDGKTWLFTGDIARMDEDGYFYIVDRKKELIKPGGFQVWPREVEETIASYPKVLEVGVGGIPDPQRGETVKAWIVLRPGEQATVEEIKAYCKEHLAPYKVPTHYEFRTELPKTTVGKILRRELIRQHKEAEGTKA